jgi:nitroreductase
VSEPPGAGIASDIADAIRSRRSVRQYHETPIAPETIRHVLALAANAPSGSNLQPWNVFVFTGSPLAALGTAIKTAFLTGEPGHGREYKYYTDPVAEPYRSRQRACGWGLYGSVGIAKGDREGSRAQRAKNYDFFGAPVGLVFTIDRSLEIGSWMDLGAFLQSIMLAARGFGLDTCAQASIGEYHKIVRAHAPVSDQHIVVCGMAMGYADPGAPVNQFRTEREPVDAFATFLGP